MNEAELTRVTVEARRELATAVIEAVGIGVSVPDILIVVADSLRQITRLDAELKADGSPTVS